MCVGVPKDFFFGSIYFTLYLPSLFGLLLSVAFPCQRSFVSSFLFGETNREWTGLIDS